MTRAERGAAAVEWVVLVPAVVVLLGVMMAGVRLGQARAAVADAAHAGARAASIQRTAGAAAAQGRTVALANLAGQPCTSSAVTVDVSGFQVPVGQAARVTASITCTVGLADLLVPGLPGAITVTGEGVAVLDSHRARR